MRGAVSPPTWAVQLPDAHFLGEKAGLSRQGGKWNFVNLLYTTVAHFAAWLPPFPGPTPASCPTLLPPGTAGPQSPCVPSHRQGGWPAVSPAHQARFRACSFCSFFQLHPRAEASGVLRTGQWGSESKVRPSAWPLSIRGGFALWHSSEQRGC